MVHIRHFRCRARRAGACLSRLMLLLIVLLVLVGVILYFDGNRARQALDSVTQHLSDEHREKITHFTDETGVYLRQWSSQVAQAVEEKAVRRLAPRASFGLALDEFNKQPLDAQSLARQGELEQRLGELEALEAGYAMTDELHKTERELINAYRALFEFLQRRETAWSIDPETGQPQFANSREALVYESLRGQVDALRNRQQEQLRQIESAIEPTRQASPQEAALQAHHDR